MLASYAARAEDSAGRRHPEPRHTYRDDFQRDRDRVIHSRAFRRLADKTQVFTQRYSDHFRSRLTHTIEVAQISRTIAAGLHLNVDLAETLALVHDIGHPPFGHSGEKALDVAMRAHGLYFDHNLHALRIVDSFEERYAAFDGLNLTFEVREGIVKHSRDYPPADYPELAEFRLVARPPLEAQLIDITDEIAYNTADLDDGLESGLLTIAQIREHVPVFDHFFRAAEKFHPATEKKRIFNEAVKSMVDLFVGDLISNTAAQVTAAGARTLEDVRSHPHRLASLSPAVDAQRAVAKDFLYKHLYYSPQLKRDKEECERVIAEMFAFWMERPTALPEQYQQLAPRMPLARVVCDYIAGMTDRYILKEYSRLLGKPVFAASHTNC